MNTRSGRTHARGPARSAARGDWDVAYRAFEQVGDDVTWGADDLALGSTAGCLLGRVDTAIIAMSRAHDAHLGRGDTDAAVRCGLWAARGYLTLTEATATSRTSSLKLGVPSRTAASSFAHEHGLI